MIITDNDDSRPYAKILIDDVEYTGLLDSGASLTILGKGCEKFIENHGYKIYYCPSIVSTASGTKERILGYVYLSTTFNNKTKDMKFYLVPNLTQTLYLGIDFFKEFGIQITANEISLSSPPNDSNIDEEKPGEKYHVLNEQEQVMLQQVIELLPNCAKLGLGKTTLVTHKIDVGDALPVKQRHYSVSPAVEKEMLKELERMKELGVIEESESAWNSPMALVRKANGKVRLCLDARKVNSVTKKDAYPLPLIDGLIGRLDKTKFLSCLDLKDAFWQIPLDKESRDKTAFTIPGQPLYQFTVMPFGLCNAPQTLCRLMHKVIPHSLHDRIFVYLDDLLITSATFQEHLSLLREVAARLASANLTINVDKSKFCLSELKYLGYIIGKDGLKVDDEKVKAIMEFPRPRNVKQIRSFLGITGWYRRFIKNYSSKAAPLTQLLKKKTPFNWTQDVDNAFTSLKSALTTAPILATPDFSRHFYLQCDASTVGVGCVLFQKSNDGEEHPIAYYSQKLNPAQKNYSVTELECLAVVLSVKKFRAYIEGHPFTIITDHASLKWLMEQRDLSGRLARWSLKLQAFDFSLEHRKGSQNVVPDALSRACSQMVNNICPLELDDDAEVPPLGISCDDEAFQEEEYKKDVDALRNRSPDEINVKVHDNRAYINLTPGASYTDSETSSWKLVVPKSMTENLIRRAHNAVTGAHAGMSKTIELLKRHYYWTSLSKDVKDFIRSCTTCKANKAHNVNMRPMMGGYYEIMRPWQKIYIDFLGPYPRSKAGNTSLIIVLDHYSKFVVLKAVKYATSDAVVNCLKQNVFSLFGTPEILVSDNGRQFESRMLAEFLDRYGVNHVFTPKYSPQANSSERVNRTILAAVRSYIRESHQDWDLYIDEISCALRNVVHESTGFSPYHLVFGQHMILHASTYTILKDIQNISGNQICVSSRDEKVIEVQNKVLRHLRQAHERHEAQYNKTARFKEFQVNQSVYVRNFSKSSASDKFSDKLRPKFLKGIVTKRIGNVAYQISNNEGKVLGIFHAKDLKS